jgi:hypothetical protein
MHLIRSALRLAAVCLSITAFAASAPEDERDSARTPKGPLPDPALLDGSAQQPEKRSDRGMLGQFDVPGDDSKSDSKNDSANSQSGQGGGGAQSDDKSAQGGGGGAQQQDKNNQGGGGGGQQQADAKSGQGGGGQQGDTASAKSGGGGGTQAGGSGTQSGSAGSGQAAQNDPNAKAEGVQVGQLNGASAGGQQGGQNSAQSGKPAQIALGDKAMQISQASATPGVVGSQVADPMTRPADAKMGNGVVAPSGDNSNRGAEKGRTMPQGL